MRKLFLIFTIFTIISLSAAGIDEAPFLPVSPRVMGMGGSFMAVADGYESLFYNPAGFANTSFSLTILSESICMYMNPAALKDVVDSVGAAQGEGEGFSEEAMAILNEQITEGGLGMSWSSGVGFVAGGLGIGAALVIDGGLYGGRNMLDISGDASATLGLVLGYAMDFDILGMELNVGADLRPMYRIHSIIENRMAVQMASAFLNGNPDAAMAILADNATLSGLGVGLDLGGILEMGPFQFGLSMRDIFGTRFEYYTNPFSEIQTALKTGGKIPTTDKVTDATYMIPMEISAGAAYNLDILKPLLDFSFHADLQDVVGVIRYARSPWALLHIGAEATLLGLLKGRLGFNQGYITMGAGVHLLFFDVEIAAFTRELGKYIKDQPNSGVTMELAIRL